MKKHFKSYVVIVLVALAIMIPVIFSYKTGHDTAFHVANVLAIKEHLLKKEFGIPILNHIANQFGYGTRIFYPPIAHTVTALISVILNPITEDISLSFKILHIITTVLSGLAMYHLGYKFTKKKKQAVLSSIIYITMPYFLTEIYVRSAIAESCVFIFIPLILSGVLSLLEKDTKHFYPLFIVGYIGAFLSHFTVMLYFTVLLAIFLLIYRKQTLTKEFLKPFLLATLAVVLVISPYLENMISHKIVGNYVVFQEGEMVKEHMKTLTPVDYSIPILNPKLNNIRPYFSVAVTILLLLTIIFRKKITFPKYTKGIVWFGLIAALLTTPIFPWDILPDSLKMIQFPWRLVSFVSLSVSLVVPLCLEIFKKYQKQIGTITIILIVVSSYHVTKSPSEEVINMDNVWWNGGMGWQREYLPVNMKEHLDYYYRRSKTDVLIQNDQYATIEIQNNQMPTLTFEVKNIEKEAILEFPRIYYLGYVLEKDGKKVPVYENLKGFVEAKIKEKGTYQLTYKGTMVHRITKIISLLTCIILIIMYGRKKRLEKRFFVK